MTLMRNLVIWLCAVLATSALAASSAWPVVATPPRTRSYWISEYIEYNTVPMQIRGFESEESVEKVQAFYVRWFAALPGFNVQEVGPARVLGARHGIYQLTVQIKPAGDGAVGTIAAAVAYQRGAAVQDRLQQVGKGFPRPPGSTVVSDTVTFDEGRRNRTVVVRNAMDVETNTLYLREEMLKSGWSLVLDRTIDAGQSSALAFRRSGAEITASVVRVEDACLIVASQTDGAAR